MRWGRRVLNTFEPHVAGGCLHRRDEAEGSNALVTDHFASGWRQRCVIRDVAPLATAAPRQPEVVGACVMLGGAYVMNACCNDRAAPAEHESHRNDGNRQCLSQGDHDVWRCIRDASAEPNEFTCVSCLVPLPTGLFCPPAEFPAPQGAPTMDTELRLLNGSLRLMRYTEDLQNLPDHVRVA